VSFIEASARVSFRYSQSHIASNGSDLFIESCFLARRAGKNFIAQRCDVYVFEAPTRFDKLFSGVVVRHPAYVEESSWGTEHIRPQDTFDADYGRLLERVCGSLLRNGKGESRPAGLEPATSWFVVAILGSKITEFHWSNSRLPRGAATRTDARSFSAAAHRTNSRSSIAPAATWRHDVAADGTRFFGVVRSKQPRLPAFVLGTSSVVRRRALTIPSGSSQRFNAIRCGRQDNEILLRNSNATRLQPSPAAYGGAEVDSH
jgi:hypothetical protein